MATRRALEVGIVIGATDNTKGVIKGLVDNANGGLRGLAGGLVEMGAGYKALSTIKDFSDTYSGQQFSLTGLRVVEMDKLGKVNERVYGKEEEYIRSLSKHYAKSVEDYANMAVVLRQNRISSQDFLGGVGDTTAKLGKVFDNMNPRVAALFFARLKSDFHVAGNEMDRLANMAFKLKQIGVGGGDANLAIHDLTEAYAKAGIGAANLGITGAKEAEELGVMMGTFIAKGLSGQTVGNNFRRIFDGLRDPERLNKVLKKANAKGVELSFFDSNGQFAGLRNFQTQLAKLQHLSTQDRADILKPFSGKQGLSTDMIEYLVKFNEEVKDIHAQYDSVTDLTSAVKELVNTLQIQNDKTENAKKNMKAAFGKSTLQDVQLLNRLLQGTYGALENFALAHPLVAGMTQEFGAGVAAVTLLIGGLKTLGGLNSTFGSIAAGLTRAFGPLLAAVAALELLNYYNNTADQQAKEDPNSNYSKNIDFFNERIEANKEDGSFMGANAWRFKKIAHSFEHSVLGKGFYDSWIGHNDERKDYNTSVGDYWKEKFPGMYSNESGPVDHNYGWRGNQGISALGYTPSITYAPVINTQGGLPDARYNEILRDNAEKLKRAIEDAQRRDKNTTYGRSKDGL